MSSSMSFFADTSAKHSPGIQQPGACSGRQQANCRNNDGGVVNQNGVWYIPSRKDPRPPAGFENMKPQDIKPPQRFGLRFM